MSILSCRKCSGEGRIFKSRYGGNDPDVWDAGKCDECDGSGNQTCDARSCTESAVGFNDDGDALCEDCLAEWAAAEFSDPAE
jgi:DnaJ-class molecular chaperone